MGPDSQPPEDPLAEELLGAHLLAASVHPVMAEGALRRLMGLIDEFQQGRLPRHPASCAVIASTLASLGRPASEVRVVAQAALGAGPLIDDIYGAAFSLIGVALLAVDELPLLLSRADDAAAAARARGSVTALAAAAHWGSAARCLMGDLQVAADGLEQARQIERAGWRQLVGWNRFYLARCYIELGELQHAEIVIGSGLELTDHPLGQAIVLEARGRHALARGDYQRALQDFLECASQVTVPAHQIPAIFSWRPLAAVAASALGKREQALEWIAEELEQVTGRYVPRVRAAVLRAGGIVHGGAEGLAMLQESVRLLERSPAKLELAHSQVELGAALRRGGQRVKAREQLRLGLELAASFSAALLIERARDELRASGARLRREAQTGLGALTPSEWRVAALAVQGLLVPDIARRLVLSPKTVEWHLGDAYRKLGVHSRAELRDRWPAPG